MNFVWDNKKNQENIIKHKVSFEEASTIFEDVKEAMINANLEEFILIKLHKKLLTAGNS